MDQKMQEKKRIAIVFGGRSTEHQISLLSAQNVFKSLDTNLYEPILIGIDKKGLWHYNEASEQLLATDDPETISINSISNPILLSQNNEEKVIISKQTNKTIAHIDVIFPVLHGLFGEDGS
ncbi:MAG: D-alanine--D-alanine ligase A, partial [Saprospiraceae bacterium]|nr:D-alanine--D-alanine ligase A [Saprospiraceae bacterium]